MDYIIYFCPKCKRVHVCGDWKKIDEEIARILKKNGNWEKKFRVCPDCSKEGEQ